MRLALLGLAVFVVLSGCTVRPMDAPFEVPESGYLLLDAEPDGALVPTLDALRDPGPAAKVAAYGAGGGIQRSLAYGGSDYGPPVVFTLPASPQTFWLNVSSHIRGDIYLADTVGSTAGKSPTHVRVHVELWVDGAFGGGMDYELALVSFAQHGGGWGNVPVYIRPEVRSIPADAPVELRVFAATGINDLFIGVGGDMQSFLAVPVLANDPLASTLYLQEGVLVQAPSQEGQQAAPLALIGAALVGVLGMTWRGGRPGLAVLMVAAVGFAGCAGGPVEETQGEAPPAYQPSVNTTVEDEAPEATLGSINGSVVDHLGLAVKEAHVSLIGTNRFTQTDAGGRFRLAELAPAKYTVRVDAAELESLEKSVEVFAGKVTKMQIRLAPPPDRVGDDVAHLHDEWKGQYRLLAAKTTLEPDLSGYGADIVQNAVPLAPFGGCVSHYGDSSPGGYHEGYYCDWPVPLPADARILPGTKTVEVVLDWDPSAIGVDRLGVQYSNPKNPIAPANRYVMREAGVPFMMQIMPDEADPGHQRFTNWGLVIEWWGDEATSPFNVAAKEIPEVTVEVYIHRGIIPFEPAHRDMWGGKDRLHVVDDQLVSHGSTTGTLPSASHVFTPEDGLMIPVGTTRIEGTFSWTPTTLPTAPAITYGLAYKAADVPAAHWQQGLTAIDGQVSGSTMTFAVDVDPFAVDQWYQTISNWAFYPTATGDEVTAYRGTVQFRLDLYAVKG